MAHLKNDLTGKQIANLFVLKDYPQEFDSKDKNRKTRRVLHCRCKCGFEFSPLKSNVLAGKTKSCKRCNRSGHLIGKKIDNLLVIERTYDKPTTSFLCRCDCGKEESTTSYYIRKGCSPRRCTKCRYPKKEKNKLKPPHTRKDQAIINAKTKHEIALKNLLERDDLNIKVLGFSHWEHTAVRRRAWLDVRCKCRKKFKIRMDWAYGIESCGCARKLKKGEISKSSKLSKVDVMMIRELLSSGLYTQREIGNMMGLNESLISAIKHKKCHTTV